METRKFGYFFMTFRIRAGEHTSSLTNLERHIQKMIAGYRKNNENELNLTDIRNKSILIEGHLKDLSILTGSVGIAITLLSLKRKTKTGKLLMID